MKNTIIILFVASLTCFGCKKSEKSLQAEEGNHFCDDKKIIHKANLYEAMNVDELEDNGDKNDAFASGELGRRYLKGINVPQNDKIAHKWFLRAALLGDARSQYYLGIIKYSEHNFFDSYVWLSLACSQDENIDSEFGPGIMRRDESRRKLTAEQVVKAQDVAIGIFNSIKEKGRRPIVK